MNPFTTLAENKTLAREIKPKSKGFYADLAARIAVLIAACATTATTGKILVSEPTLAALKEIHQAALENNWSALYQLLHVEHYMCSGQTEDPFWEMAQDTQGHLSIKGYLASYQEAIGIAGKFTASQFFDTPKITMLTPTTKHMRPHA